MWKQILWRQFGAAIDALENAITACPDDLWADRSRQHEFWYMAYHTLFWLDYYLSESHEGFAPPEPFGLEELDPAGIIPERPYTKDELLSYLEHGHQKCRGVIENLTDEQAAQPYKFGSVDFTFGDLLLYNMRHVQHHTGQINLLLRQAVDSAPRWVFAAKIALNE